MRATNLQFIWHTKLPVFSIDFHPTETNRFATCGGDDAVRLWRIVKRGTEIFPIESDQPLKSKGKKKDSQLIDFYVSPQVEEDSNSDEGLTVEYIATLDSHIAPVNAVRYSPDGNTLASAGDDGAIILWKKKEDIIGEDGKPILNENSTLKTNFGRGEDEYCLERWKAVTVLRGSLADVYALAWSPSGQFLISGSVDNTAKVWDISSSRCIAIINEHRHYVQGVAWDPCGEYLVTQSSDRSVKFHTFTYKPTVGKFLTKCISSHGRLSSIKPNEAEEDPTKPGLAYNHLYQSETLASFFRRPDITPDGGLIITPAGICKEGEAGEATYAVHIYPRNMVLSPPYMRLNGFPKPPIAIRCSPVMYERKANCESVLNLDYYCVFAVATQDSVFVFNTHHSSPIAHVSNLHTASLTDVAWACDGCTLIASSADGYASILKFSPGELGVPVSKPVLVKVMPSVADLCSEPMPVDLEPKEAASPTILTPRSKVSVLEMMRKAPNPSLPSQEPLQAPSEETPSTIPASKKRRIVPTFVSHLS